MSDNKVTVKDIKKAVKILKKYEIKPDEDVVIEVENPSELYDFLKNIKPSPRYTRVFKNITE